jgi:hypothetical protein
MNTEYKPTLVCSLDIVVVDMPTLMISKRSNKRALGITPHGRAPGVIPRKKGDDVSVSGQRNREW